MSDLITRIKARAAEGLAAEEFRPDCVPACEGPAIILFGIAMVALCLVIHAAGAA